MSYVSTSMDVLDTSDDASGTKAVPRILGRQGAALHGKQKRRRLRLPTMVKSLPSALRATLNFMSCGGLVVVLSNPLPRRTPDAQRDLFDEHLT
jgi:hypothetical protein